jgi:hypothetical protein
MQMTPDVLNTSFGWSRRTREADQLAAERIIRGMRAS